MSTLGPENAPDREQAVQLLRELGLTGTEAEVYFAALQTAGTDAVSSYRLAQLMGRDPANVAKTITALVRRQAMSVVQDKPRLYRPAAPADLAKHVQALLKQKSEAAVELLRHRHQPAPQSLTLGLANADQVYAKVRELLVGCRRQVLVCGSKEALREIGAELEEAGARAGCAVQALSPVPMITESVLISVFDLAEIAPWAGLEFLHLVVDERAWLSARLDTELGSGPCGWWGDHSPMAAVMAGSLVLAMTQPAGQAPRPEPRLPDPPAAPAPDTAPEALPPSPLPTEAPAFEEGLTFLLRHDLSKPAAPGPKKKGER